MRGSDRARPDSRSIDTASWITLRGTRYFRVHLEQDLWQQWLLTQVNARTGSRLGRYRATPSKSVEYSTSECPPHSRRSATPDCLVAKARRVDEHTSKIEKWRCYG
jgi:hypothetical protein